MKPNILTKLAAVACFSLTMARTGQAKINVVATLPDCASLAREIGSDNVDVSVLAKTTEDPHFVDARPSFVVKLRQPDILIDRGAELEISSLSPRAGAGFAGNPVDGIAGAIIACGGRRARDGQPAFHGRSDHRESCRAAYRECPGRGRSAACGKLPGKRKEI